MRYLTLGGLLILLCSGAVWAQGTDAVEKRELIYCADLMTHEEREAYRAKMRAARGPDEKARLRAEHRAEMEKRAQAHGTSCEHRRGEGQGPGHQAGRP
ncbi:MAG: hypothetical protein N3C63_03200 [Rhodocyclaceae bacterium]|nr:hypothetical protein [Rhodocyclaceae bacterium]